jgi:hypothetical protein
MIETGALIYWFDIRPDVVDDWLAWYLRDHMPSRVGTTFTTGRCFEAIDAGASHMVLFETESPEALLAPDYLQLLGNVSDDDRKRRGWYTNAVRMTARVQTRIGAGMGNVLAVARFDDRSSIVDVQEGRLLEQLASVTGVGSVWMAEHDASIRARMDAVRVTGHQDRSARQALMIEASRDSDAAQALAMLGDWARKKAQGERPELSIGRYRLLYSMAR